MMQIYSGCHIDFTQGLSMPTLYNKTQQYMKTYNIGSHMLFYIGIKFLKNYVLFQSISNSCSQHFQNSAQARGEYQQTASNTCYKTITPPPPPQAPHADILVERGGCGKTKGSKQFKHGVKIEMKSL